MTDYPQQDWIVKRPKYLEDLEELQEMAKIFDKVSAELEELRRKEMPKKLDPSEKTDEAFDKIKELNEKMPESLKQKFKEAMQGKGKDKQPTSAKPNWDEIEAFEAETLRTLNQNKTKAPQVVEPKGLSFNKTPSFDQAVSKRPVSLTAPDVKTVAGMFSIKS